MGNITKKAINHVKTFCKDFKSKKLVQELSSSEISDVPKPSECYEVHWVSRYGIYYDDLRNEVALFTNHDDANDYADALRKAFKLLRHTSNTKVKVKRSTHG